MPQSDSLPFGKNTPTTFIATLGSEPQVVTATLDLLMQMGETISTVIILHTVSQETSIQSAVDTLSQVFRQPPYQGQIVLRLLPILDARGHPLADVNTPTATQEAFRFLYQQVLHLKRDGHRLHFSISGGRKLLALFVLATAQLVCDEGDALWYLYSSGNFLASKRLHPQPGDEVQLIQVPFLLWSQVSPAMVILSEYEDPYEALARVQELQFAERMENARAYILGSLSPAERRVVTLLVQEGLSDAEIGERLCLSPRTVEQHLRSAYMKAANHWELEHVSRAQLICLLSLYYNVVKEASNS